MSPNGMRPRRSLLVLATLVMALSITGVVVQFAVSDSLGHWLIGGGVLGANLLTVVGLRKRTV